MNRTDALSPGSHAISVNGIEQRYFIAGQGPLCIVHSGGPGINWEYLRMPLVEQYLTTLYVEPIGTGASGRLSDHPRGYSVERFSVQLACLVAELDLSDVMLLGHSHGGFVVQHFALAHPERVAGIILYDSSAVTGGEFMMAAGERVAAFAERHARRPEAEAVLRAWQSIPAMGSDADYTAAIKGLLPVYFSEHHRVDIPYDEIRSSIRATLLIGDSLPFDVRDALPGLAKPALILVGDHDFICGPRWANILHDLIPDARLVRFAASGHFAHVEQAQEFAEAIVDFAHGVAKSRRG
jgi:pimeloyl-ACP methyl ester carboxylesterase